MITLLQCWLAIPVAADDSTSKTVLAASGANRYTPGRPPPNSRALRALPASCPQRGKVGCFGPGKSEPLEGGRRGSCYGAPTQLDAECLVRKGTG